jgi:hypothetical protein
MNKEAVIKRLKSFIRNTAGEAGEEATKRALRQINSRDASTLLKNTLKQTWMPIAGAAGAAGLLGAQKTMQAYKERRGA